MMVQGGSGGFTEDDEIVLFRKFDGLPPIPGYLTNVVGMLSQHFVMEGPTSGAFVSEEMLDVSSSEENKLTTEVCRHLLNNGVHALQLLCNFSEYPKAMAAELVHCKQEFGVGTVDMQSFKPTTANEDSVDVTVVLLLTCSGSWQQQRMFEMVRDAYHASRLGVIILGNASIIQNISQRNWHNYVISLAKTSGWTDHLEIVCHRHRLLNKNIFTAADLKNQSPMGGCHNFCGDMSCGHRCPFPCHPVDADHLTQDFRCMLPCKRQCPFGHVCKEVCWKDCGLCFAVHEVFNSCVHSANSGKRIFCFQQSLEGCTVPVKKKLPCDHYITASCSADVTNYRCTKMLGGVLMCGHGFMFQCGEKIDFNQEIECQLPVRYILPCGHNMIGTCADIISQGGQLICGQRCNAILTCGHCCGRQCHFMDDPDHKQYKCQEPCGQLCARKIHACSRSTIHPCSDPCPPCQELLTYPLPCGHVEEIMCGNPDPDLENYICGRKCIKVRPFCNHTCSKICGENCGNCEVVVTRPIIDCPRGHTETTPCSAVRTPKCRQPAYPKTLPACGHLFTVYCSEADTITEAELAIMCVNPCRARFDKEGECGHMCLGTCRDCFQGRLHMRCQESCGKTLFCGHSCTSPCANACPPCRYACFNICEHTKCEYECGVPCERDCEHPCVYECVHSACTNQCREVCNKEICFQPCPEVLKCGHNCTGFCGETCPPFCGICTPEKLLQGVFSGLAELDPKLRFIYLPDCGHCIESDAMQSWLGVQSDEIMPIRCPVCQTRISWLRRYSNVFHENFKLINSIRTKVFGNKDEIEGTVKNIQSRVTSHVRDVAGKPFFSDYVEYINNELNGPRFAKPNPNDSIFISMSIHKAQFLDWVTTEWIHGSKLLVNCRNKLCEPFSKQLENFWREYFIYMIADRVWPMHPNEIIAMEVERKRMDDTVGLYMRLIHVPGSKMRKLMTSYGGMRMFKKADSVLRRNKVYSLEIRMEFLNQLKELDALMNCTINLSDTERRQIVYAFGEGSGRWFKCANGHVYVVTECGGATERGTCNECGAAIGGENHVLEKENYLATEMDGAELPLYPTALMRPPADANRN